MEQIQKQLERMNTTLEGILQTLNKPENKVLLAFQYGSGVVAILGILAIIDIIVRWIIGG
ncbi:hypothetical protein AGMMS49940_07580 [Spirochaetia bacterium]|nr:hypothetical protein AGMMS49940_07580 [Spirochaetia bacterium]